MITALALLGYAACAAWCAPALLAPLTRRGVSVRAGLAAWLTAMASVLASAAVAIQFSFRSAAAVWPAAGCAAVSCAPACPPVSKAPLSANMLATRVKNPRWFMVLSPLL